MKIFTIGYEGLTLDEFTSLLNTHQVDTLVDVRYLPLSRKKGFSKTALGEHLFQSGLGYVHFRDLGCPKPTLKQYREDKDWGAYTQSYLKYLDTQSAALGDLEQLAEESNCALMCFEADYEYCHRSLITNTVGERRPVTVFHLSKQGTKTEVFGQAGRQCA